MARRRFPNIFPAAGALPALSAPAPSSPAPRGGALLASAACVGALLAVAGCGGLDQASAAGVGPADAVAQIAGQLEDSAESTHTATYRLAGGDLAKIIQDSSRTAYVWSRGRLIVTPDGVTRCAPLTRCTETAPGAAELAPDTGLITLDTITAKLRAAAADPALSISERDTTIAGRHAACVTLTGTFEVCVIGDGTLAAFTGTLAGHQVEMTLTDLTPTADESDFEPPPGAAVTDSRPK